MESMGERLRYFRKEKRLTATVVARKLGVAVSTYRRWEAGGTIAGDPYVNLAKILGISLNELFGMPQPTFKTDLHQIQEILERMKTYS